MSLDAIGIVSTHPEKSVAFYKLLGVELKKFGDHDHYEATLESGMRLMLDSDALIKELVPGWKKPTGSGVVLCFKQSSAKGVDDLHERLLKESFKSIRAPWDAFWGQRYACVSDPDGNQIDLFAQL
jgi:uncharacterized glyoxalase superfamily protein PhnB